MTLSFVSPSGNERLTFQNEILVLLRTLLAVAHSQMPFRHVRPTSSHPTFGNAKEDVSSVIGSSGDPLFLDEKVIL